VLPCNWNVRALLVGSRQFNNEQATMGFATSYVRVLNRVKWLALALCAVLFGLSAWQAPLLVSRASTQFEPPPSTLAARGNSHLELAFPGRGVASPFALFVQQSGANNSWISSDSVREFSLLLNATLGSLSVEGCGDPCVLFFNGYWTLREMGLPEQAWTPFVNAAGNATYIAVEVNTPFR
jgi:hypothetical protein